mmetsp:Transcript_13770/g.32184  ORF Transcript_13770/g.32184 Transcript_13770/m.32184 type:complete len:229 (-) Transcript_13770:586-1272(-)
MRTGDHEVLVELAPLHAIEEELHKDRQVCESAHERAVLAGPVVDCRDDDKPNAVQRDHHLVKVAAHSRLVDGGEDVASDGVVDAGHAHADDVEDQHLLGQRRLGRGRVRVSARSQRLRRARELGEQNIAGSAQVSEADELVGGGVVHDFLGELHGVEEDRDAVLYSTPPATPTEPAGGGARGRAIVGSEILEHRLHHARLERVARVDHHVQRARRGQEEHVCDRIVAR